MPIGIEKGWMEMHPRGIRGWLKHVDFFVLDAVCLYLAAILAYKAVYNGWLFTSPIYQKLSMLLLLSDLLVFLSFNTMHNVLNRGYYVELMNTLRHCGYILVLAMLVLYFTYLIEVYTRDFIVLTFLFHVVIGYFSRVAWKWFVRKHLSPASQKKLVIALLDPGTADDTMKRINHSSAKNYEITGVIINGESDRTDIGGVPVVAHVDTAADFICSEPVDAIYVDCPITDLSTVKFMNACVQMAIPFYYHIPPVFGEGNKYTIEHFGREFVLTSSLNYATLPEQAVKRAMDIVGGLVGSVIAIFIILILGPKIKKASPGPLLFVQERIGFNGRRFKLFKLRSMCMDAEQKKQELMEQNRVDGDLMFKLDYDPRIIGNEILPDGTVKKGIGDFIRRTSLDEFPQFFNVLLGQMSLVGTRPPTTDEWERYKYHHRARLACKPGITGLWQVSGRSEITDFEEVVALDTQYILNWSISMDLKILLKTFRVVLDRKGAL